MQFSFNKQVELIKSVKIEKWVFEKNELLEIARTNHWEEDAIDRFWFWIEEILLKSKHFRINEQKLALKYHDSDEFCFQDEQDQPDERTLWQDPGV